MSHDSFRQDSPPTHNKHLPIGMPTNLSFDTGTRRTIKTMLEVRWSAFRVLTERSWVRLLVTVNKFR